MSCVCLFLYGISLPPKEYTISLFLNEKKNENFWKISSYNQIFLYKKKIKQTKKRKDKKFREINEIIHLDDKRNFSS